MEIFGARVRQARILRRMTGKAVMERMGWKGSRQTRLEQAESTAMDADEVSLLAEVLQFPVNFLTAQPVSKVSPADLLFRTPKSTTQAEREYLSCFAAVAGDFTEVLRTRWELPPVKLSTMDRDTAAAKAARTVRADLGVSPEEPIGNLMYAVERSGVAVVLRSRRTRSTGELDWTAEDDDDSPREKHLGYSTRIGEFRERPLIVVRAVGSWERTRWTLAHEVGHLALHAHGVNSEEQEDQASRFASELLAPADAIADEMPKMPTLLNLVPLKMRWGISLGALIRHLHESGLVDQRRYRMLQKQLYTRINPDTGHTWGRTEPGWDERKPERPRLLAKWMERGFGATSVAMLLAQSTNWPDGHAEYPLDLLEDLFAGQRSAPQPGTSPTSKFGVFLPKQAAAPRRLPPISTDDDDVVVDFGRFRQQRHA